MGIPIVVKSSGGLPVTLVSNGRGTPMEIANNGFGIAVTVVASGGLPVTGFTTGPDLTAPIITSSNTWSQPENTALLIYLSANEAVTWAKVGGADSASFTLGTGPTAGQLSLPAANFEVKSSYVVQVQATDLAANPSAIQTITVTITDVDEIAPTITSAATFSTPENIAKTHTLTANETVTWSIVGGADAAQFSISGGNILTLAAQDYEAGTSRVVQVRATDTAGNQTNQTITATITDVAEGGTAPGAPTLDLVAASDTGASSTDNLTNDTTPELDFNTVTPLLAGDILRIYNNAVLISTYTAVLADIGNSTIPLTMTPLSVGSNSMTATHERGGNVSSVSAALVITVDTTAPTLASASGSPATGTTASISVSTNEGNGTCYYVVTASATKPSAAQVKAGLNDTGSAALTSGNAAVSGTGTQSFTAAGLSAAGTRYAHFMHEDAAGNQSTVATSSSWTQAGASGVVLAFKSAPPAINNGFTNPANYASVPVNNSTTSDVVVVCIANNTGAVSNVYLNDGADNAMTLVSKNTFSGTVDALSIWKYTGKIFTTPTVKVVAPSGGFQFQAISVYVLSGANPAETNTQTFPFGSVGVGDVSTTAPLVVPSGGVGVAMYAAVYNGDKGLAWAVGTQDCFTHWNADDHFNLSTAHLNATGSPTVTLAFGNFAGLLAAAWGL